MKNKTKYIILSFISLFIIIVTMNIVREKKSKNLTIQNVENLPLSHEYVNINFYYNQLNSLEQNVYNKIIKSLDTYEGGEIILDENISINNLSRIADAIRFNNNNNYFYSLFTLPLTSNNKIVNWSTSQRIEELEKKQINKILLEIYIGEDDTRLDNFHISDDLTITNYDEQKNIFESIPNDLISKYESIKAETDRIIDDIILNMPKNLNQEEAINYFSKWIVDNMKYTDTFNPQTSYGDIVNEECQFSASISSITKKSAVCSGFSMILSELCSRVGIESYICLGTVSNGGSPFNHAWVAVNIGDKTYYKDPTREVGANKVYPLMTKEELPKGSYILRFSRHFNY